MVSRVGAVQVSLPHDVPDRGSDASRSQMIAGAYIHPQKQTVRNLSFKSG
jgi:hypothetical protein